MNNARRDSQRRAIAKIAVVTPWLAFAAFACLVAMVLAVAMRRAGSHDVSGLVSAIEALRFEIRERFSVLARAAVPNAGPFWGPIAASLVGVGTYSLLSSRR